MTLVEKTKKIQFSKLTWSPIMVGGLCDVVVRNFGVKTFVTENPAYCIIWYYSNCKYQFICCMVSQICIFKDFSCSYTIWRTFRVPKSKSKRDSIKSQKNILLKNNPCCINYETSHYLGFSGKQKEYFNKPWKTNSSKS